ncbi:MAG: DUF1080 domain-containing protein [Bacteroidota bacterium]|nr:DUF1080 domain-containing protein [Bacteroidota bacterium]
MRVNKGRSPAVSQIFRAEFGLPLEKLILVKAALTFLLILVFSLLFSQITSAQNSKRVALFNGRDLSGWQSYIGPPLDDAGKPISSVPVGLNRDPHHVFTVVNLDGEKVIRISGENWGCIYTPKEYSNFHLQLQFKWGKLLWGQKKGKRKDSGVLYFSVGPNGADYGAWMRSQEFQVEQGNCGDYWGVAGGRETIPVIQESDSQYVYNPQGKMTVFSATSAVGRHCIKQGDAENPTGQWNTLDLYCHGDTSVQMINGKVMMVLYHSSQEDHGAVRPLAKGKIQIQSEGAEIYYKNITIGPLKAIPAVFLKEK